jgi:hypothetical protein
MCCLKNSTLKRAEVMEAIAGRIAVRSAGFRYALGHHLSGSILVIGAFFFFLLAIQTNHPVIEDRQDSAVSGAKRIAAPAAFCCT